MKSTALSLLLLPVVAQASFLGDLATNANRVASSPYATGGDVILHLQGPGYADYVHVFTNTASAGAFTPSQALTARLLLVAGGGGGGNKSNKPGGGAGGMIEVAREALSADTPYAVTIGSGSVGTSQNKDIGRAVQLDCPRAEERGGCRVFDYEVTATLVEDDVDLVQVQRRFIAPDFFLPLESKIPSCRFRLALSDLRLKGHYRFGVTPVESFGKKGRTIWSETAEIKA